MADTPPKNSLLEDEPAKLDGQPDGARRQPGRCCWLFAGLTVPLVAYVAYALPLRRAGQVWVPMGPALCAGLILGLAAGRLLA